MLSSESSNDYIDLHTPIDIEIHVLMQPGTTVASVHETIRLMN